ncbi:hypothetical protein J4467_01620 [Candidatus Woesearchaeota archaeon]|nr:hypothetical protein [Candidatus Woesearchaeota archaeon]
MSQYEGIEKALREGCRLDVSHKEYSQDITAKISGPDPYKKAGVQNSSLEQALLEVSFNYLHRVDILDIKLKKENWKCILSRFERGTYEMYLEEEALLKRKRRTTCGRIFDISPEMQLSARVVEESDLIEIIVNNVESTDQYDFSKRIEVKGKDFNSTYTQLCKAINDPENWKNLSRRDTLKVRDKNGKVRIRTIEEEEEDRGSLVSRSRIPKNNFREYERIKARQVFITKGEVYESLNWRFNYTRRLGVNFKDLSDEGTFIPSKKFEPVCKDTDLHLIQCGEETIPKNAFNDIWKNGKNPEFEVSTDTLCQVLDSFNFDEGNIQNTALTYFPYWVKLAFDADYFSFHTVRFSIGVNSSRTIIKRSIIERAPTSLLGIYFYGSEVVYTKIIFPGDESPIIAKNAKIYYNLYKRRP